MLHQMDIHFVSLKAFWRTSFALVHVDQQLIPFMAVPQQTQLTFVCRDTYVRTFLCVYLLSFGKGML